MTTTMRVFLSVLAACALIALLAGESRNWGYYALGSLIIAAFSTAVFAGLKRFGGRGSGSTH